MGSGAGDRAGHPVEFTCALSGVHDARYILAVRQFEPIAEAAR
jgi:hypothetical protein